MLTTPPVLAAISNVTLSAGSPFHVPLNAADADGQTLTFSVDSTDARLVPSVEQSNRSIRVNVTDFGSMVIELFEERAPRATQQVVTLAQIGHYNNTGFHHIADNGRLEGGAPAANPFDFTPSPLGRIDDQFHVDLQHNRSGLLSLATSSAANEVADDTIDSRFFVTSGPERHRDAENTIVGLLIEGDDVRQAIASAQTNATGRPLTPILISSVDVFLDDENGVLTLNSEDVISGTVTVTVTVADPDGHTDQKSFDVTVVSDSSNLDSNTPPWLADVPQIRTLVDVPTAFQLSAVDVEGDATSFSDEDRLRMFNLTIPHDSHEDLDYNVDFDTGATTVTPSNGLSGTQSVSVATSIQPSDIDYQVVPIEIVTAASTWDLSAADHPAGSQRNDGNADTFRLVRNGSRLEFYIGDVLTAQAEDVSVSDLTVSGSDDDDRLIIDHSGGNPVPVGGIDFAAGTSITAAGNSFEILGGTATNADFSFTIDGDSQLTSDGVLFSLSGITSIRDTQDAENRSFVFTDAADAITVGDDGTAADGVSRMQDSSTGFVFDFRDPSGILLIDVAGGDDSVVVSNLDGGAVAVTILGGAGADTLGGGNENDRLDGDVGDDSLDGKSGDDTLVGAGGDDVIAGGDGLDLLADRASALASILTADSYDGEGTDVVSSIEEAVLTGNELGNIVDVGSFPGPTTIFGGAGNDSIYGSAWPDFIDGGDDDDFVLARGGNDLVFGGNGNDDLRGSAGKDFLNGGAGEDYLQGQSTTGDSLQGGLGDDTLDGGKGNDVVVEDVDGSATLQTTTLDAKGIDTLISIERASLVGGSGNDWIDGSAFSAPGFTEVSLLGGGGKDMLIGGEGNDLIVGNGGNDTLFAADGNDRVFGGSGADRLYGENGDDKIRGNGGSGDKLTGGPGNDTLDGDTGNDRIIEEGDVDFTLTNKRLYGLGTDVIKDVELVTLLGGPSDNRIDAAGFTAGGVIVYAGDGNDEVIGGRSADWLFGGNGSDTLMGGHGDDTLEGESGDDGLSGWNGNDLMSGGDGNDTIIGGMNEDTLFGGFGLDTLIGEDGDDSLSGEGDVDVLTGGNGDGTADAGDVFDDITENDEFFQLNPVPDWMD